MSEPTTLRAGDSATWTVDAPGYSAADGWLLKYRLLFVSGSPVDIATTGTGTAYTATLTSTATLPFIVGQATLVKWAEKTGSRVTLAQFPVAILQNLAVAGTLDGRSANAIALANARAALATAVAGGQFNVITAHVDGREITFRSVKEITDLINHYKREVAAENAANAVLFGVAPGRIYTRM